MVKNLGGNKNKKIARKNVTTPITRVLRKKNEKETCEMYAAVIKILGGPNIEVICEDGVTRNCVMRSKFRGRQKRDNLVYPKTYILVGLRDWEKRASSKKETCDMLCVYSDEEKEKLKTLSSCNWKNFSSAFPDDEYMNTDDLNTEFKEESTEITTDKTEESEENEEDIIDIDEI